LFKSQDTEDNTEEYQLRPHGSLTSVHSALQSVNHCRGVRHSRGHKQNAGFWSVVSLS